MPLLEESNYSSLACIREITQAINQSASPEIALDQVLDVCICNVNADTGSIMLLEEATKSLSVYASRGLSVDIQGLRFRLGQGITGWVAKHGKARIVSNANEEKDYVSLRPELLSELAVPMCLQEKIIGVLSVDAKKENAFTLQDQELLSIIANLTAQIFINLKDNQTLKLRDRFHRLLIEISRILSRSLELKEVFQEVMKLTEKAFRLQRSTLLLYSTKKKKLYIEATSEALNNKVSYAPGEGITGQVFLSKKAIFIPDVSKDPDFLNRTKLYRNEEKPLGFFCTPIFSENDVVGVFSTFMYPQKENDPNFILEFLEILASSFSQAVIIQNLIKDETRFVRSENIQLKQELSDRYQFGSLIGRSEEMQKLFKKAKIASETRASILITGESGTGKELIASAIHYNSPRCDNAFVKLNCASIPDNLLESELFGYRKGAFTGAYQDKKGKFEIADKGTIFLDEIGDLNLNLQSKLLRVLQEREIEPVGGNIREIDIRVLAATNANLIQKIKEGSFREDLFYRLNVIDLEIPPLRERREDILPLIQFFIKKHSKINKKERFQIDPKAIELLEEHRWPGNVRELENRIERAIILSQKKTLFIEDFPDIFLSNKNKSKLTKKVLLEESEIKEDWQDIDIYAGRAYHYAIQNLEEKLIRFTLEKFRHTKTKAANYLGINRNTLDKKIQELKIYEEEN